MLDAVKGKQFLLSAGVVNLRFRLRLGSGAEIVTFLASFFLLAFVKETKGFLLSLCVDTVDLSRSNEAISFQLSGCG